MLGVNSNLIGGLVLGSIIAAGGLMYWDSQNRLVKEAAEKAEAELKLQVEKATKEQLLIDTQMQQEELDKLNKQLQDSRAYLNKLEKTLSRHDLTRLTAAKPGLIERRINDATQKLFNDLTDLSSDGVRVAE